MIDIHCHLLPGIDDGASTIEQSLELARHAVNDGITHMVVTPHIQPELSDGKTASAVFVGTQYAGEIVLENPWKLVGGMFQ